MNDFEFYSPTKIVFGKGKQLQAAQLALQFGATKVLLHHSGGSSVKSGLIRMLKESFEKSGLAFAELDGVLPNPRIGLVRQGIELCQREGVDFIIAVGGGSVIDSAKAIALGVANSDIDVWEFFERRAQAQSALPLGVVLTIPAAGSESSDSVVITGEGGVKRGYGSPWNRPKFAILNPELCESLPKFQIGCGVVDIMMHTLERFVAADADNYLTDKIALSVLKTAMIYGKRAFEDAADYKAMSELMWAGSVSHNGITGLGNSFDMPVHALGHELSGAFDVAHGASLCAMWGSFALYVYRQDCSRFACLSRELFDVSEQNDEKAARAGIEKMVSFFKSLDMPVSIGELLGRTLDDETLNKLAVKATFDGRRTVGRFMPLSADDLCSIYKGANR